jgi:GntR family transcriptional regulator/MocR family aminotransferase
LMASADGMLITGGSQQGLALVTQLLLKKGDVILVENPTYSGALSLYRALGLKPVGIPIDEHGMRVDQLEKYLQQYHPGLIYTIPNFHNPTGACLSLQRRYELLALAERYNVPILEDDFVGDLRFEGRALPALKALDSVGQVIYISTFSKMLMPGLRVGFVAADGPVYDSLVHFKRMNDLATSNLMQRALEAYVTVGRYQNHLRRTVHAYRRRRDAMLQAINRYMPVGVSATQPLGGLFIWLQLPEGQSARELLPRACAKGVAFAPGDDFFAEGSGERFMRLNFAANPEEAIETGVERLARVIREN